MTAGGLRPDPSKVEAIANMPHPHDKDSIDRLRGTINYLSRFIPRLSDVFRPIAQLSERNVEWNWGDKQESAFTQLKDLITTAPTLSYFDPKEQLVIQCDASNSGLGAALLQAGKPLAYASRTLTDPETRYAIIEKEMLAIVFALEKWHQYTYGRPIIVQSDHKPLEAITRKPLDKAPKRLQTLLLRALAYDTDVRYLEGKKMLIADTLSRATATSCNLDGLNSINTVGHLAMRTEILEKFRQETKEDPTLQNLKAVILHGWLADKACVSSDIAPYFPSRDELGVSDGLIFRGERVVVPRTMRPEMKQNIHI